jgi:hypothetical protein
MKSENFKASRVTYILSRDYSVMNFINNIGDKDSTHKVVNTEKKCSDVSTSVKLKSYFYYFILSLYCEEHISNSSYTNECSYTNEYNFQDIHK